MKRQIEYEHLPPTVKIAFLKGQISALRQEIEKSEKRFSQALEVTDTSELRRIVSDFEAEIEAIIAENKKKKDE